MVGVHPGLNFLGSTEMNRKKFVSFAVDLDNLTHLSFTGSQQGYTAHK